MAYQMRFTKFLLSMLYFNFIYDRMAEAGKSLLDGRGQVRASAVAGFARESTRLDRAENVQRLDRLDTAYRKLGGRYATFADLLAPRRERLLDEAQSDIADFALLVEAWEPLVRASTGHRSSAAAGAAGWRATMTHEDASLFAALAAAAEDQIIFDLAGIEERYETLCRELPGRLRSLCHESLPGGRGAWPAGKEGRGVDAASLQEMEQALRAGVPIGRMHYGNTVKSDRNIVDAYRLGIRDFATDSLQDVAAHRRPRARCPGVLQARDRRGRGALGARRKYGCSAADAVLVLETARARGLTPRGCPLHVGSQQMTPEAWHAPSKSWLTL